MCKALLSHLLNPRTAAPSSDAALLPAISFAPTTPCSFPRHLDPLSTLEACASQPSRWLAEARSSPSAASEASQIGHTCRHDTYSSTERAAEAAGGSSRVEPGASSGDQGNKMARAHELQDLFARQQAETASLFRLIREHDKPSLPSAGSSVALIMVPATCYVSVSSVV